MMNMFIMQVLNIPEFDEEPGKLTDSLERGERLHQQLEVAMLGDTSSKIIKQMLIGRQHVSMVVRRKLGVTMGNTWTKPVNKLKEEYGGGRKSHQRQTSIEGQRVGLGLRRQQKGMPRKKRLQTTDKENRNGQQSEELRSREQRGLYDIGIREDAINARSGDILKALPVYHGVPDKIKMATGTIRLDEAVDIVREEDEDFQENRRSNKGWTKVTNQKEKRETPRREYRAQ
ncbi:hypothetical protein AAG570_012770 [Ranatra chinensis]|uniref:Uncharacterized protein n=1 Tax=Ranatra chinensis TaxID=642074 RepID=A0ABD0YET4_9HEMI